MPIEKPTLDGDGMPDDAHVMQLLSTESKGPLKPLDEAAAEEDETGLDEQQRLDDGDSEDDETEGDAEDEDADGEEEEAEEEDESDDADEGKPDKTEEVLDAVLKTLERIEQQAASPAGEKKEEGAPAEKIPARIQKLIDSDDPELKAAGEALLEQHLENRELRERVEQTETREQQRALEQASAAYEQQIDSVAASCNPPLTDIEKDWLVDRMTERRGEDAPLIASLTVRQGVEQLFPGRLKATPGKTTTTPKKGAESERTVVKVKGQRPEKVTIDDRGGSAGPKPTPAAKQAPANESLEQAVERGWPTASTRR